MKGRLKYVTIFNDRAHKRPTGFVHNFFFFFHCPNKNKDIRLERLKKNNPPEFFNNAEI